MNAARLAFLLGFFVLCAGCLAESYPGIVVGNPNVDEEAPQVEGEESPEVSQIPPSMPETPEAHDPLAEPQAPEISPTDDIDDRIHPIVKEPGIPRSAQNQGDYPGGDRMAEDPEEISP